MTGLASRAADGLDSRPDFRLGIALALACALHAAVIWGIDPPVRGSAYDTRALDIRLIAGSAPASSAEIPPEQQQGFTPSREEPASALPESGSRSLDQSGLAPDAAATVHPQPGGREGPQSDPGSSSPWQKSGVAPRVPMRPPDKARGARISGIFERRATQSGGMQRRSNAGGLLPRAARPPGAPEQQTAGQTPSPEFSTGSAAGNNTVSYSDLAREIASTHAAREQAEALEPVGTRARRLTGSSAKSTVEAAYLDMWRQKTERIGRANYPPGGISGELLLLAIIRQDGALEEVRVLESSGFAALDEAAMRTVRLAAPYSHFPTEMRKSYDRLEIVRRWRFERQGAFLH